MAELDLTTRLGPLEMRSPLVAAAGTFGAVHEFAGFGTLGLYGAAVAKSVSRDPWPGRPAPRLAAAGEGMLNGIGIQNPGIEAWAREVAPLLPKGEVPVWGSAVGHTPDEFAFVARRLAAAGVEAVEVNLSCPNLEDERMFALDPALAAAVVSAVRAAVDLPLGAKLSPNAADIAAVAGTCRSAGADWVVVSNTQLGAAIDPVTRRPRLSIGVGGLSGPPLKPVAMRCLLEIRAAHPDLPILGCGGVTIGEDVAEYLLAGASAVGLGTVHFAEPRAARRITRELSRYCREQGVGRVADLIGAVQLW
jgi:dihydroorotate dehydrogenase (NAD+) catalytic subunit